jgi:pectate lyase
MKHFFFFTFLFLFSVSIYAQTVVISEAAGWLESAYVKWQPVTTATSYNVYYSGNGLVDQKIDDQLIRSYGTYHRADILGLKAGTYTIKIVPVISGVEGTATETSILTVLAQDRTGYSFWNSRVPGAYKADGTIKDNAVIVYVTENSKNTVSLNVTGATTNPCVGIQTILDGFKKAKDTRPLIVRLIGQITDPTYTLGGDLVIENGNNASSYITFEGVGDDAVADGWGLRIKNASNIEVRNLGFMNCDSNEGDNVGLQQDNDYVWVHNCDMFYGNAGSDADQIKGDGALDCKKSTYVTFSYNHFWDNGKCNLLGLSEGTTSGLFITYHHNWYDHSDSRHPRVRYYSAHVYNNYYDGNAKYGAGSTLGSSVFMEGNYFRNCKYPMLTSMQGSDVYNETTQTNDYKNMPTFSNEDGGTIKAFNNYMEGQHRFVAYGASVYSNSTVDFDAYVVSTRSETIPETVKSVYGSNAYNNFDTNSSQMYVYTADSPEDAKTKVMQYAGRINGGDLKWTFTDSTDDAAYAVNVGLKAALTNYQTSLVSVQGESGSSNSQTLTTPSNCDQTVNSGDAITDIVFTWGGDATDVTVTGLPASGLVYVKDATAKTITISGTPTATVTYSITTSGIAGTPITVSGTITISAGGGTTTADMVHNFTTSGKTSTFYTITGNLSTNYGPVSYSGLTLTQCLKMESSTSITFTITASGTFTLVFSGTGAVNIDGTSYTPVSGIVTATLTAGTHTVTKSGVNYLFYMSWVYSTTGLQNKAINNGLFYPNPVSDRLNISSEMNLQKLEIYTLSGVLINKFEGDVNFVDMSKFNKGVYLIKTYTNQGVNEQMIIKK